MSEKLGVNTGENTNDSQWDDLESTQTETPDDAKNEEAIQANAGDNVSPMTTEEETAPLENPTDIQAKTTNVNEKAAQPVRQEHYITPDGRVFFDKDEYRDAIIAMREA